MNNFTKNEQETDYNNFFHLSLLSPHEWGVDFQLHIKRYDLLKCSAQSRENIIFDIFWGEDFYLGGADPIFFA